MRDVHAQLQQPDGQRRKRMISIGAPRRAVVGQDATRQAIAWQDRCKVRLHGHAALVAAEPQSQAIPRMIVQHRQGMTAARFDGEMPFPAQDLSGKRLHYMRAGGAGGMMAAARDHAIEGSRMVWLRNPRFAREIRLAIELVGHLGEFWSEKRSVLVA